MWDPVPLVAGKAAQNDAVAQETVEPPGGDDARDVAILEAQLVVRRSELRSADAPGGRAAVVEGAELRQHGAVHDRDAARRVAHAQIARVEVLRARRRQDEKPRHADDANEQGFHDAPNTPLSGSKVPQYPARRVLTYLILLSQVVAVSLGPACRIELERSADSDAERLYAARFPDYRREELDAYRFYVFRPRRLKVFDESKLGAGVLVTARLGRDRRLVWECSDIYRSAV